MISGSLSRAIHFILVQTKIWTFRAPAHRCFVMHSNKANLKRELHKDTVRYLGVLLDSQLSWKFHIEHIAQKISKSIGIIAKLRHFVPSQTMFSIYKALITPYANYGICSWGNAAITYLKRVLVLQKRALRLINFSNAREHTVPFFLQTRSLPINFMSFERVHDIFNNQAPDNLNCLFLCSSLEDVHRYTTRSKSNKCIYVDGVRTESCKRSFHFIGIKIWNSLPASIKSLNKFKFKTRIKNISLEILEKADNYLDIDQIIDELKSSY